MAARPDATGAGSGPARTFACSYDGSTPSVSGCTHICTNRTGSSPDAFRSECRTPLPALMRCTSPARRTPELPAESACSSAPDTTHVTISMSRCECSSKPAPGATTSSLQTTSGPNPVFAGS
jgi:hypothetical protein